MEEKENEALDFEEKSADEIELVADEAENSEPEDIKETENENPIAEEASAFKWEYSEQFDHDKKAANQKTSKRGAIVYGAVMLAVFALAFAILAMSIATGTPKENVNVTYDELSVVQIVEKGMPSSVSVLAVIDEMSVSSGSGFVIHEYGYVVTNYHVVENASRVVITDSEGKQYSADVVGYSAELDLALLYAEGSNIKAATLANSDALKLGETVVAIGCPTGSGTSLSVSNGIVSGLERQTSSLSIGMIQTNAPLNPGNSGGPLFDSRGNVAGIVTSKLAYTTDSTGEKIPLDGIAYAIPINSVKSKLEVWMNRDLQKPMLGITAVPVEKGNVYFYDGEAGSIYLYKEVDGVKYKVNSVGEATPLKKSDLENKENAVISAKVTGIYVVKVTKGLGAYGKLKKGDIVTGLGGARVEDVADARDIFRNYDAGDTVKVEFYRNGNLTSANMTLKTKGDMLSADRNS